MKVVSHPEDLLAVLCDPAWRLERVGLEAGSLSQWLFSGLTEAGVPAICIETRHAKALLKAQVNKSDRNDARGIAQMMRVGLFRPVHVKTLASQKRRALLVARKILQEKALAIENDIRGLLRNFGLKVGIVGVVGFEKFAKLHRKVLLLARGNEVWQRLMTIPRVGPVVSLAFISTVDVPARFRNSKAVGPSLAAQVMLTRVQKWSWLKAWAMNIAKRRGQKKAIVALARRLAVIMHRMWSDGTEFRWTREMAPTI
jgi:transposase